MLGHIPLPVLISLLFVFLFSDADAAKQRARTLGAELALRDIGRRIPIVEMSMDVIALSLSWSMC